MDLLDHNSAPTQIVEPGRTTKWKVGGCAPTIALIVVLLIGLVVGAVCFRASSIHRQAIAEVKTEIAQIRTAVEPITPDDMYAFHCVPGGVYDTTDLWLTAIALYDKTRDEDCELLPMIGNEPDFERLAPDHPSSLMPVAERYLANHADVYEAVRRAAAAKGEVRFPLVFEDGIEIMIPHVTPMRLLARLFWFRSRMALARGDAHESAESLLTALECGEALRQEPLLVSQLVRGVIFRETCRQLEVLVESEAIADTDLRRIQDRMANIEFSTGLRLALLGERSTNLLAFYQIAQSNGSADLPAVRNLDGDPIRPKDCAAYLRAMRQVLAAVNSPGEVAADEGGRIRDAVACLRQVDGYLGAEWNYITEVSIASLDRSMSSFVQSYITRDTTIAGIAARRYHLRNSTPPRSLEVLVPDFIDVVPTDPYSQGKLLLLRKSKTLAVFSIGENGIDDQSLFTANDGDDIGFVFDLPDGQRNH
ncbi:MAG TPA: hypothetical protein VMP01_23690 [Pirellulaceae bacterium]|nr:hypothetical protein [Pirellulaceae bacterium]